MMGKSFHCKEPTAGDPSDCVRTACIKGTFTFKSLRTLCYHSDIETDTRQEVLLGDWVIGVILDHTWAKEVSIKQNDVSRGLFCDAMGH